MATVEFMDAPGEWYNVPDSAISAASSPWDLVSGNEITRVPAPPNRPYMDGFGAVGVTKFVPANASYLVAESFSISGVYATGNVAFRLLEGTTVHLDVRQGVDGVLQVTRNGTVLATGTTVLDLAGWYWIQLKATIHDTTGSFELRINNVLEVSGSNVDTRNGGTGVVDRVFFGTSASQRHFHRDIIVISGSDAAFMDHQRVRYSPASGAGASTQWTPSAGNNWENVDGRDTASDNDSTYNSSDTNGQIDLYEVDAIPGGAASILAVAPMIRMRKDDAGSQTARRVLRVGGTNYEGPNITLGESYLDYFQEILDESPDTSSPWTPAEVAALQVGVKKHA